jgi:hypothetical protein
MKMRYNEAMPPNPAISYIPRLDDVDDIDALRQRTLAALSEIQDEVLDLARDHVRLLQYLRDEVRKIVAEVKSDEWWETPSPPAPPKP